MSDTDTQVKQVSGGVFAALTFLGLGLTSTVAQMVAWSLAGLPPALEWSTGGLIALVTAIAMWIWCRSWSTFFKVIWIPALLIAVISFAMAQFAAANVAVAIREADRAQLCSGMERYMDGLVRRADDLAAAAQTHASTPRDHGIDWTTFGGGNVWVDPDVLAQQYWDDNGGPDLEAEYDSALDQYTADCR